MRAAEPAIIERRDNVTLRPICFGEKFWGEKISLMLRDERVRTCEVGEGR